MMVIVRFISAPPLRGRSTDLLGGEDASACRIPSLVRVAVMGNKP
jgi:hypothetical protein